MSIIGGVFLQPIILASTSPRRQEILKELGIPFTVVTPQYEELPVDGMNAAQLAEYHAMKKVESVIRTNMNITASWVLGADTLIHINSSIFGKPSSRDEAKEMLMYLSGNTHEVITALCLFDAGTQYISTKTSISRVTMIDLDEAQVEKYLDSGEWQGAAGSYKIQGLASCFISSISGSFSGIVGLPIHELYVTLREHGYDFVV